jgi:polyferredoxin
MHETDEPEVENVYRLQIMNTQEVERDVTITVSGLEGIELEGDLHTVRIAPASSRVVPLRVEAPRVAGRKGSNRIEFTIEAADPARPGEAPIKVVENATFVIP